MGEEEGEVEGIIEAEVGPGADPGSNALLIMTARCDHSRLNIDSPFCRLTVVPTTSYFVEKS